MDCRWQKVFTRDDAFAGFLLQFEACLFGDGGALSL
jgi:hypothetical protein